MARAPADRSCLTPPQSEYQADARHPVQELSLRFQLPQERGTYVDLVDNEDVQLMFDEWQEYADQPTTASSAKLQVRLTGPYSAVHALSPRVAVLDGRQEGELPAIEDSTTVKCCWAT